MRLSFNIQSKVCNKCKEIKLFSRFSKRTASTDGYQSCCKVCKKECRSDNLERTKELNSKYRAANLGDIKDRETKYRAANPEKNRSKVSRYRAKKLLAIPSWLTKEDYKAMETIYKEADRLTRETGIKHHVDHIHPLQGKLVSGLHCPANLQILTDSKNYSKCNKFTPYVESELAN